MCHCGKGLLERVQFALKAGTPLTAQELAERLARPRGTIHPALNVLRTQGQVRRYAQIMNGKRGRPRVVYQAIS